MTDIKKYEPLWGAWQVDAVLGEGSFGKVYRVRREEFGKTHYSAVKLISIPQSDADVRQMQSEGMDDASMRSYFHACATDIIMEINLMSEFRGNSNIVSFEDHKVLEQTEGWGWDILIRMELLRSLTEYVTENPLSHDEVIRLGIHICRALELCAVKNTIHRDIKPDNIFVSQFGDYKLGDFGIARQIERTSSGLSKKGTYTYMAPEVFAGSQYGACVDMYSLGIVMYRFLNKNRTPFLPVFPQAVTPKIRDNALNLRMKGEPIPSINGISPELNAIVLRACEFNRQKRFAHPAEMREALEAIAGKASFSTVVTMSLPTGTETAFSHANALDDTEQTEAMLASTSMLFARLETISADKTEPMLASTSMHYARQEPDATHGLFGQHTMANAPPYPETAMQQHYAQAWEPPKRKSKIPIAFIAASLGTLVLIIGILYLTGMFDTNVTPSPAPVAQAPAVQTPTPEAPFEASLPLAPNVGDVIRFGLWDWRVLEVRNSQALIITENVIGLQNYHLGGAITWETSDMRQWLNGEFLDFFNRQEQARIAETIVTNSNNPWDFTERGGHARTSGGGNTTDRVFLLSIDEVLRFFGDSGMVSEGAAMGANQRFDNQPQWPNFGIYGVGIHDQYSGARIARDLGGTAVWWWLRSPGGSPYGAAFVDHGGNINLGGNFASDGGGGVRPVLLLNLE